MLQFSVISNHVDVDVDVDDDDDDYMSHPYIARFKIWKDTYIRDQELNHTDNIQLPYIIPGRTLY